MDYENHNRARLTSGRLRLDTLVRLRWMAIAGQSIAVIVVHAGLGFPLELGWCFGLIALSAWLNIFLRLRFTEIRRLENRHGSALLAYDILQLAGLLFLTGGLDNPFAILLMAPVVVSAAALPRQYTIALGLLASVVASGLALWHWPLPWLPGQRFQLPLIYSAGVWLALISTLIFMGIYAFQVADEARQLADALAATELVLEREHHLSTLDGLAAAAAHELGTPLGTIAVIARELERDFPEASPHAEDLRLLRTQSERCREILGKLRSLSSDDSSEFNRMRIGHLIEELAAPSREFGIDLIIDIVGDMASEPSAVRNPAILYGLGNFLENAIDYAETEVDIIADWNDEFVELTIADDGPGFAAEVIDQIGEPYVTQRGRRGDGRRGGGLGLGFFIAKTLLERTGASIARGNRKPPETGAVVTIRWPRAEFEKETQSNVSTAAA